MLNVQRRLAAKILKCGTGRVRFDPERLDDIKEAITKADIRSLIGAGTITRKAKNSTSGFHTRKNKKQKKLGRRRGPGSRKGKSTARLGSKPVWMNKIRLQRSYLKEIRQKGAITTSAYHELYMKSKGGFFRNLRHLKLYISERGLVKNG